MALQEAYISINDAAVYLVDSTAWTNATTEQKTQALFWGRVYIDTNYKCATLPDTPSENVKYANALLAEDWLEGTLFQSTETKPGTLVYKRVRAGSVESQKSYSPGYAQDDVNQLLLNIEGCTKKVGKLKQVLRM